MDSMASWRKDKHGGIPCVLFTGSNSCMHANNQHTQQQTEEFMNTKSSLQFVKQNK